MKWNNKPHTSWAAGVLASFFMASGCSHLSPSEATALKDAYGDRLMIGVAVNRTITMSDAGAEANNVDRNLEEVVSDTNLVKKHYRQIVDENDLKWALVHPNPGPDGYDFAPADAYVQFGLDNDMYIVGHTLVWHGQTPVWVYQADPTVGVESESTSSQEGRRRWQPIEPLATREQLLERMRDHIHTVVGRYKGKVQVWDVVNEALADKGDDVLRNSYWRSVIGDDFIAKAFQYAHEADPDAILRYNDYGLENPEKRERLKTLIRSLLEQNVPVHAIGTQTHINVSTSYETMDETLTDLATLGLPIHITELDVNAAQDGQHNTSGDIESVADRTQGGVVNDAEARQAAAYENLFRAIMKHRDSVTMVTFWGVNDEVSWLRNARPLLFDGNNQPKAAFDAVMTVARDAE